MNISSSSSCRAQNNIYDTVPLLPIIIVWSSELPPIVLLRHFYLSSRRGRNRIFKSIQRQWFLSSGPQEVHLSHTIFFASPRRSFVNKLIFSYTNFKSFWEVRSRDIFHLDRGSHLSRPSLDFLPKKTPRSRDIVEKIREDAISSLSLRPLPFSLFDDH